jgi:hypothetical protein
MIRRFAATFLSITLAAGAASAQQFAQAPDAPAAGAVAPGYRPPPTLQRRAPGHAVLVNALAIRRAQNLARFHAYRTKGVYPHDYVAQTSENIWRDDDGHLCAAATIIDADDQHELVEEIAKNQNGVKLGEVTSGPLLDWILTSGFTQVEISTIQEPFEGPPPRLAKPDDGTWKIAEDARLRKKYARIEKMLRDNGDDALEQAADRLAKYPALAWSLVYDNPPVEG